MTALPEASLLVLIALAFVGGGLVKGVLGIGLPLVVVPVIATATDPLSAVLLMVVPAVTSNIMQVWQARLTATTVRRFWPAAVGVTFGGIVGSTLLAGVDPATARIILACVVVLFCFTQLLGRLPPVPTRHEPWVTPVLGAASGMTGGLTGFFGLALVPYLMTLRLAKEDFVATIGMLYLCGVVALYASLVVAGAFSWTVIVISAAGAIPTLAGVWVGSRIRRRVNEHLFRRLLVLMLVIMAVNLLRTSLVG